MKPKGKYIMKIEYEIRVSSAQDKESIIKGLINSGYVVTSEFVKSNQYEDSYWLILIHGRGENHSFVVDPRVNPKGLGDGSVQVTVGALF
jgi:ribulose bisphosphate carboxylase small subunit